MSGNISEESPFPPAIVKGKYIIKERVGSGSFGQLFIAISKETGTMVAIKLEKRVNQRTLSVLREGKVMEDLLYQDGFSRLYSYGQESDYNFLVTDLLGSDLERLFKQKSYRFTLKTCLMIVDQMLARIETLHARGYIHRDIKPENFCMNKGDNRKLFIIDFGLAKKYKDSLGKHILCTEKKGLVGTARYAAINSHLGKEQSRRDDLEAIGYVIIYLMKGRLPWQDLKAQTKQEKYNQIAELKVNTSLNVLCKDLPEEFVKYMTYVKGLEFSEDPDYNYARGMFKDLFIRKGYEYNYKYDWLDISKEGGLNSVGTIMSRKALKVHDNNIAMKNLNVVKSNNHLPVVMNYLDLNNIPLDLKSKDKKTEARESRLTGGPNLHLDKSFKPESVTPRCSVGDVDKPVLKQHQRGKSFVPANKKNNKGPLISDTTTMGSLNSSKDCNISKTRHNLDDEIPIETTSRYCAPTEKILETRPLEAKTKSSYYITEELNTYAPDTARTGRRRTFFQWGSTMDNNYNSPRIPASNNGYYTNVGFASSGMKLTTTGEENLNESSICEQVEIQESPLLMHYLSPRRFKIKQHN